MEEKEQLEVEKLKAEIRELNRSPWKKPSILIPILIPLVAIVVSFYINKDYVNLKLELKALKLEKESLALEERKKND